MPLDTYILQLLISYQLPALFAGAFFFGETVILSAAFLAGQGVWSIVTIFWITLVATIISDSIWFIAGKKLLSLKKLETYKTKYEQGIQRVEQFIGIQRPFLVLLFIKFLYGTRILTIIYLSHKRLSFWLFLLFTTIGTILWLIVMLTVGWMAGKGIANTFSILDHFEKAAAALILFLIIYKLVMTWTGKRFLNK